MEKYIIGFFMWMMLSGFFAFINLRTGEVWQKTVSNIMVWISVFISILIAFKFIVIHL